MVLKDERLVSVALPAVDAQPGAEDRSLCPNCGSRAAYVHQRLWRSVLDPWVSRVLVLRYRCKRCGAARRVYPRGLGAGRQSDAARYLSVALYCAGLSLAGVREVLGDLGCRLSTSTIRKNVATARVFPLPRSGRRGDLVPREDGRLAGATGNVIVRITGPSLQERWLEFECSSEPSAADLRWRFQECARQATAADAFPPGSV